MEGVTPLPLAVSARIPMQHCKFIKILKGIRQKHKLTSTFILHVSTHGRSLVDADRIYSSHILLIIIIQTELSINKKLQCSLLITKKKFKPVGQSIREYITSSLTLE